MAVLSLPDAKAHLNITTQDHDAELSDFIAAAQQALTRRCGPLEPTTKTCRVAGRGDELVLRTSPAVSLTSVTEVGGSALTLGDLYLDTDAAIVTYNLSGYFGAAKYTVVYEAGRAECPEDLLNALKDTVKHLWQTQRGGSKRPSSGGGESYSNTLPGAAYAYTFRIEQLIGPHLQVGI